MLIYHAEAISHSGKVFTLGIYRSFSSAEEACKREAKEHISWTYDKQRVCWYANLQWQSYRIWLQTLED